jgi:hypothetical protein
MVSEKLDLLQIPHDKRVELIKEIRGELEHKVAEARLQRSSLEVTSSTVSERPVCKKTGQTKEYTIKDNKKKAYHLYIFANLSRSLI